MHMLSGKYSLVNQRLKSAGALSLPAVLWIIFILLPLTFIQCESFRTQAAVDIVSEGDMLPSFSANLSITDSLDWRYGFGESFDTEQLQDKVGVVVFFHTSCDDCKRELPVVQSVYDNIKNNVSVSLVCISRAESESEICDYFSSNKLSLPYSAQPDRRIYELFATVGIPRIYIADARGVVRKVYTDSNAPDFAELMKAIENSRTI